MTKYAIFIEPTGNLKTRIEEMKCEISISLPDSPYCDHPAHSSIFVAPMTNQARWSERLSTAVSVAPFAIEVDEPIIFYDDAFTGGHTLALRVRPHPYLYNLQSCVAQTMAPFVDRRTLLPLPQSITRVPFLSSYAEFGFPFVGSHWIPHFTIASLRTPRTHPMIANFLSRSVHFIVQVTEISLWLVIGEVHKKLQTIHLRTPPNESKS